MHMYESDIESRVKSFNKLSRNNTRTGRQSFKEICLNYYPLPKSFSYKILMRIIGIKIGNKVKITGRLFFKIRGEARNIVIKNNVTLSDGVDLRNRENGKIIIHENAYLDSKVRLVAARDGKVEVGSGTEIGSQTVINSGGTTIIGRHCMIASNVNINSSTHGVNKAFFIKDQPHEHGYVIIGDDVWIGSGASVLMNTRIGEGAVIATNAVARKEYPPFSISGGVPAKIIKYRT